MRRRSAAPTAPAPGWSRQKMLALLIGAATVTLVLVAGLALAVNFALQPAGHAASPGDAAPSGQGPISGRAAPRQAADLRDVLAARPMPTVVEDAAQPGPVSTRDPGPPILLPAAMSSGPAQVPTGFPHDPAGAMAQLAAIDQVALQSGALAGARAVIAGWAAPGGPTGSSWSLVRGLADLLDSAGLSGGGSPQLAIVATPLMGLVKGSVGPDFVIPCVDFELDVTLAQTARAAAADCQRMLWSGGRWLIGPGPEPATPPSVWPDTDLPVAVGYRDLRPEPSHG